MMSSFIPFYDRKTLKKQIFSPKKKKFYDLQNLHPGVSRGAETDFGGPRAPGRSRKPFPGEFARGGLRQTILPVHLPSEIPKFLTMMSKLVASTVQGKLVQAGTRRPGLDVLAC